MQQQKSVVPRNRQIYFMCILFCSGAPSKNCCRRQRRRFHLPSEFLVVTQNKMTPQRINLENDDFVEIKRFICVLFLALFHPSQIVAQLKGRYNFRPKSSTV